MRTASTKANPISPPRRVKSADALVLLLQLEMGKGRRVDAGANCYDALLFNSDAPCQRGWRQDEALLLNTTWASPFSIHQVSPPPPPHRLSIPTRSLKPKPGAALPLISKLTHPPNPHHLPSHFVQPDRSPQLQSLYACLALRHASVLQQRLLFQQPDLSQILFVT